MSHRTVLPEIAQWLVSHLHDLGGTEIALDVWVTQEQEGLKGGRFLRSLLLFHNPDTQSSVWVTPPSIAFLASNVPEGQSTPAKSLRALFLCLQL